MKQRSRKPGHFSSHIAHFCEPLENRALLTGDPVIVLTEHISLVALPTIIDSTTVSPWLWNNPGEYAYDLDEGDWDPEDDGDMNGYPGDVYGWNFNNDSPNIVNNVNGSAGGSAAVLAWADESPLRFL